MSVPHAPGLGVSCPECGQVHLRCIGHRESKGDGHLFPCGRTNSDGQEACYTHGGPRTPAKRQRARKRGISKRSKAMDDTLAVLNVLGVPIDTDPLDALRSQVAESAGIVAFFRERLQQLKVPDVTDPKSAAGGFDSLWHPSMAG